MPPPPPPPPEPDRALRSRHEALGPLLHARTATPQWLGERLDVGWAIGVRHPRAGLNAPAVQREPHDLAEAAGTS